MISCLWLYRGRLELNISKPTLAATLVALVLSISPALAQPKLGDYLHEFRVGASFEGVVLDDRTYIPTTIPLDRLQKLSFEALFRTPFPDVFQWVGSPKPTVGATVSLVGGTSWAFAGLTWQIPVFETPLFVEGTVGATIHDGALHAADVPPGTPVYGCRVLLYTNLAIGWDIGDNWTASVNFEHGSHGRLCGTDNNGFNTVGFKVGYKF